MFIFAGAVSAFLAVALGAFGAHGLKQHLTGEALAVYHTAVLYHLVHSLALLLVGVLMQRLTGHTLLSWSGSLFLVGVLLFSGSLYALSITGVRSLGIITPVGGLAFLGGWATLALWAWKTWQ